MPFIKYGGLFIPTKKSYQIGNEIFMLLKLMDDAEKIPVAGKVVWVTPPRAQGTRVRGIGIQFNDTEGVAKTRIENILAGQLESDKPTHTM
ncbi:MAG: PilZ domain-containing protein [Proteobacteria bacterium]|nr:PilZ domain-containing protein [Pseudomonadota bacterium]